MENKEIQAIAQQNQPPVTQKLPYTQPQATFVPLKMEERLTMCGRNFKGCAIKGVS